MQNISFDDILFTIPKTSDVFIKMYLQMVEFRFGSHILNSIRFLG